MREDVPGGRNATCSIYEECFKVVALVQAWDDDNLDTNFRMFEMTGHLETHLEGPTLFDERDRICFKILLQLTSQPLQHLLAPLYFSFPITQRYWPECANSQISLANLEGLLAPVGR